MRAGFTADFIGLPDGLPGLRTAYGLAPKTVSALAPAVKYQALVDGEVDIIDAYSTDGLLSRYPLTVLDDDRHFFPPYDAPRRWCAARWRANGRPRWRRSSELSGRLDVTPHARAQRARRGQRRAGGHRGPRRAGGTRARQPAAGRGRPARSTGRADSRCARYLWDRRRGSSPP